MDYDGRYGQYRIRIGKGDLTKHKDLLSSLMTKAHGGTSRPIRFRELSDRPHRNRDPFLGHRFLGIEARLNVPLRRPDDRHHPSTGRPHCRPNVSGRSW